MEYHVGMITNGAIAIVLVNGVPVADSASWSLDTADVLPVCGRQLNKSFMLHLNCGDVVSIIILVFITDNFFIDSFYDDGNFKFLTTMALHLQDPDKCNHNCKDPSGGLIPTDLQQTAASSEEASVFHLKDRVASQQLLLDKTKALSQLIASSNPINPAQIIATFLGNTSQPA
jgi:hypothetical protein